MGISRICIGVMAFFCASDCFGNGLEGEFPRNEREAMQNCQRSGDPSCRHTWRLLYEVPRRVETRDQEAGVAVGQLDIENCTNNCVRDGLANTQRALRFERGMHDLLTEGRNGIRDARKENLQRVAGILQQGPTRAESRPGWLERLLVGASNALMGDAWACQNPPCGAASFDPQGGVSNGAFVGAAVGSQMGGNGTDPQASPRGSAGQSPGGREQPGSPSAQQAPGPSGPGNAPPRSVDSATYRRELDAFNKVSSGRSVMPADLSGLRPIVVEPLYAASRAREAMNSIDRRITQVERNIENLLARENQLRNTEERLASNTPAGLSPPPAASSYVPVPAPAYGYLNQYRPSSVGALATAKKEKQLAATARARKEIDDNLFELKVEPSMNLNERETRKSGISPQSDLLSRLAVSLNEEENRDSARRRELREKLKKSKSSGRSIASVDGKPTGGDSALGPDEETLSEQDALLAEGRAAVIAAALEQKPEFSMTGSETEAEIQARINEAFMQGAPEVLGSDSGELFERVRQLHRRYVKQSRL